MSLSVPYRYCTLNVHVLNYNLTPDVRAPACQALLAERYTVVVIELPGHGLSGGDPAVICDFDEYGDAIADCLRQLQAMVPQPWHGIGQSTGAAALMNYLLAGQHDIWLNKCVFLAPLLRTKGWFSVNVLYLLLHRFMHWFPRKFSVSSHDSVFMDFLANKDPLQPRQIAIAWVGAMRRWEKRFAHLPKVKNNALIILQASGLMHLHSEFYPEEDPEINRTTLSDRPEGVHLPIIPIIERTMII